MSSTRKHASGSEKRKMKHIEEFNASQRGAIHKFLQAKEPSRNNEELAIVVWQQQDKGSSLENIDNNNNNVSGHENPPVAESSCVDEQSFFSINIYDPRN
jgi:hypothetical protein